MFFSTIGDTASSEKEVGQTFTVGVDGTLTRVEVYLALLGNSPPVDALLTVYDTSGGLPNAELGSALVSSTNIHQGSPAFVSFDLSAFDIPAIENDVLAFGIKPAGIGQIGISMSYSDVYGAGTGLTRTLGAPPGPWQEVTEKDFRFKTYVVVVPEPTTLALSNLGWAGLALWMRWLRVGSH